jgi:hypothetical protein
MAFRVGNGLELASGVTDASPLDPALPAAIWVVLGACPFRGECYRKLEARPARR